MLLIFLKKSDSSFFSPSRMESEQNKNVFECSEQDQRLN